MLSLPFVVQRAIRMLEGSIRRTRYGLRWAVVWALLVGFVAPSQALAAAPSSGFGSMAVSPTTATADDAEFGGDTFTFTFTNNTSLTSSSAEVDLAVPADWSNPNGSMAVSYPGSSIFACKTTAMSISGSGPWTVVVTGVACKPGQSFILTYAPAGPPTKAETSTFTTRTVGAAGETAVEVSVTGSPGVSGSPTVTITPGGVDSFTMSAPSSVTAGVPFSLTLTAIDDNGNVVTTYAPAPPFSWDPGAASPSPDGTQPVLPGVPAFQHGVATVPGFILYNAGDVVDIGATDGNGIFGESKDISVNAGPINRLQITQEPDDGIVFTALDPVQVSAEDVYENPLTTSGLTVSIALGANPGHAVLQGTLQRQTDSTGVATFDDLTISQQGIGYTLVVSSAGLAGDTSTPFEVDGIGSVVISRVTPGYGPAAGGNTVTITGLGFMASDASPAFDVTFGPYDANILSVSNNGRSMKVQAPPLPPGAPAGPVHLLISTDDGTNDPTSPASKYIYGPVITSISPPSGPASGGNTVTLNGASLLGVGKVLFGTASAPILAVNKTGTAVTVKAPPQKTGAPNAIHVQATVGPQKLQTPVTDGSLYSYGPLVTKITPAYGSPLGGNKVRIAGKNLGSLSAVHFGSATLGPAQVSLNKAGTAMVFKAPAHVSSDSGVVNVWVTTSGGDSGVTARTTYSYVPAITSFSPTSGLSGVTTVRIKGKNFLGATAVSFGGTDVNISNNPLAVTNRGTQITVVAPVQTTGFSPVSVMVINAAGTSPPANRVFFYND